MPVKKAQGKKQAADISADTDNYTRRVVRSASIIFFMGILASLSGYLLRFLLARTLSPADFGLVYTIFSLFGVLLVAKELGLRPALSKHITSFLVTKEYNKIKGAFLFVFLMQFALSFIIGSAVIILVGFLSKNYFHTDSAFWPLIIYAAAFMIHPIHAMFKPTFQGFQYLTLYSLIDFLKITGVFVATLILLPLGFGVSAPMIGYLLVYLFVPLLVYIPLLTKKLRRIPGFLVAKMEFTRPLCRQIFLFGLPLIFGEMAGILMGYSDTLVLAYFSLVQVGLYNVALPVSKILWRIPTTLTTVLFPLSSELWARGDVERLRTGLARMHKYSLIVVFPLSILAFVYAETIIKILFGSQYIPAATALRFLVFGAIFYTIAQLNLTTLLGIGHSMLVTKLTAGTAIFDVAGNLVLIPFFGMMGAVFTTVANFALLMALSAYYIRKHVEIPVNWLFFLRITILNILYAGFIFVIGRLVSALLGFWPTAVIVVLSSSLFYFVGLFVGSIVSKEELFQIWHRIKK